MDNLVALVTGANKGIGKETARQLADAGLTVYIGSRDAARGQRAVEEIGGDTRLLVLDVTHEASIADAARQVARRPGPALRALPGRGETAAPHLAGYDQGRWLARLDADQANLRRATELRGRPTVGTGRVMRLSTALGRY